MWHGTHGALFAHEWAGVTDMMVRQRVSAAVSRCWRHVATEDAGSMVAGSHSSTYGGNPLACGWHCRHGGHAGGWIL